MAERTLLQVWVDEATADRVTSVKKGFRLDNAELLRQALSELLARLEAMPAPFPPSADTPQP